MLPQWISFRNGWLLQEAIDFCASDPGRTDMQVAKVLFRMIATSLLIALFQRRKINA